MLIVHPFAFIAALAAVAVAAAFGADEKAPPKHTNRLVREKSPYLLQHAHNPVDWYPWGPEAFERARKENKPIFLSIGYSTCHWCHVMERESFEDEAVAKLMNETFVCIKVDREERPDVDRIYMNFIVASTGHGGWPMTVFLTPDLKPFAGGTYFPPEDKGGQPGMKSIVPRVAEIWAKDNDKIIKQADSIAAALKDALALKADPQARVFGETFHLGFAQLKMRFDKERGGFGRFPKFPQPGQLDFLLAYGQRKGNPEAAQMVLHTMRMMAAGGMQDQLGGGFHRYSTDGRWFLPHFEKMLYDQGQLANTYLDAWNLTRERFYADTAKGILDYVLRDMTGPAGQFFSAEDADSAVDANRPKEKAEGAYFVWSYGELVKILGKESAEVFAYAYGVEEKGNVVADPHQEFVGKNVLYVAHDEEQTAGKFAKNREEVAKMLGEARGKLLAERYKRPHPHLDDKTIVAWNGLMISAFARAGVILDEPKYTAAAIKAATFIRDNLYDAKTHSLKRRFREGQADVDGFLEDYAMFISALLDLYETTLDIQWLKFALDLQGRQDELFYDAAAGGYFTTAAADTTLLLRMKDDNDGAEPSGNSVAVRNLLRMSNMLDDKGMRTKAQKTIDLYASKAGESPLAWPVMLIAGDFAQAKPKQIVLAGKPDAAETRAMLREIHGRYLPTKVVIGADGGEGQAFLAGRVGFLKEVKPLDGKTAAYVCENFTCQLPTADVGELRKLLEVKK